MYLAQQGRNSVLGAALRGGKFVQYGGDACSTGCTWKESGTNIGGNVCAKPRVRKVG
jgi:hypothetical protein